MAVYNDRAGFLASGTASVSGAGLTAIDCRATHANRAIYQFSTPAESAIFTLETQLGPSLAWFPVAQHTATTTPATAQVTALYPFVRISVNALFSGAGGTGYPIVYYTPGLV